MSLRPPFAGGCTCSATTVGNQTFDDLDVGRDAVPTADHFRLILKPSLRQILSAVERQDDDWIWRIAGRLPTSPGKGDRRIEKHS